MHFVVKLSVVFSKWSWIFRNFFSPPKKKQGIRKILNHCDDFFLSFSRDSNLRDQILSLKRENARLKELLNQHGLLNRLNPESNQNGSNPSPKIPSSSDTTQVTPKRKAGCSCQGKCATRVCGCVKKQIPCGESCRCADDQCQNQVFFILWL